MVSSLQQDGSSCSGRPSKLVVFLFADEDLPGRAFEVEIAGLSESDAAAVLAAHGPQAVQTGCCEARHIVGPQSGL